MQFAKEYFQHTVQIARSPYCDIEYWSDDLMVSLRKKKERI